MLDSAQFELGVLDLLKVKRPSKYEDLHNLVEIPEHRVGVVLFGWVEPEEDPLFSVTLSSGEDIGLQNVRLPCSVPQELEVDLIVL